jgi:hypothetical protein
MARRSWPNAARTERRSAMLHIVALLIASMAVQAPADRVDCDVQCRAVIRATLEWVVSEYGIPARAIVLDTANSGYQPDPGSYRRRDRPVPPTSLLSIAQQAGLALPTTKHLLDCDTDSPRIGGRCRVVGGAAVFSFFAPVIDDAEATILIRVDVYNPETRNMSMEASGLLLSRTGGRWHVVSRQFVIRS